MKNISTHVAIAVVSLVLVIASAFLITAPEAGIKNDLRYNTEGRFCVNAGPAASSIHP